MTRSITKWELEQERCPLNVTLNRKRHRTADRRQSKHVQKFLVISERGSCICMLWIEPRCGLKPVLCKWTQWLVSSLSLLGSPTLCFRSSLNLGSCSHSIVLKHYIFWLHHSLSDFLFVKQVDVLRFFYYRFLPSLLLNAWPSFDLSPQYPSLKIYSHSSMIRSFLRLECASYMHRYVKLPPFPFTFSRDDSSLFTFDRFRCLLSSLPCRTSNTGQVQWRHGEGVQVTWQRLCCTIRSIQDQKRMELDTTNEARQK